MGKLDSVQVREGQIIGLRNGKLTTANDHLIECIFELLEDMADIEPELITLYYGEDITQAQADELVRQITAKYDELEVEVYNGGQQHYQYIFSVE